MPAGTIRLTTAGRKFVASADDTPGLLTDARMVAVLPECASTVALASGGVLNPQRSEVFVSR